MVLRERLAEIQQAIRQCETTSHREKNSVSLLVASKGRSVDEIAELVNAGQFRFGENYLQEALPKIASLPKHLEWHFIGPIQSNKTRKIAEHFSWVQSVANRKIAQRLNAQRPNTLPPLNICLEVNIDHEASKTGIDRENLIDLAKYCLSLPNLTLRGLMCIPAPRFTFAEQRQVFHQLFLLQQELMEHGFNLDTLSMGMSADFSAAIAEGATLIRIGSAIFKGNP